MCIATRASSSRRSCRRRWSASSKSSRVEVSASTRLLAVIGDPVAHSLSPSMQNAAIRVLGLDAVYVALRTSAPELTTVLAALAAVGGAGNVTVPHKEAAERCVARKTDVRSEEHTSELQSRLHLVCRLLLEKKKTRHMNAYLPMTML